ncbi:MAG: hypothetical protein OXD30_09480, partial [Bryobacterales bacterium]|nr:hypothetical protein [Bryobacterales bacterium]
AKEQYLDTGRFERLGRIQSFKQHEREICWELREAWDREMARLGTVSFPDRLIAARDHARRAPKPTYRSAIIDEGQDLTLVGMELIRAMVAGQADSTPVNDNILVMDDSAQRIYSGGFKPKWAGLDFSSYSEILKVNYRNSKPIFEAAKAVRGDIIVAKEANDDGAATDVEFEREEKVLPELIRTPKGEAPVVKERLRDLVDNRSFCYDEVAVLTLHNEDAKDLVKYFNRVGVPCTNLQNLRDEPLGRGVRVGTFDRAKGLEFRAVFIVRVGKSRFPFGDRDKGVDRQLSIDGTEQPVSGKERELRQLRLDRLYAAMTRARDRLYVISDEDPCDEILQSRQRFQALGASLGW